MNVYDFSVRRMDGDFLPLGQYEGKVLLIVNTAGQCTYARQLAGLELLYKRYKDKGLAILAFPCNQFRGKEPGSNDEISEFYRHTYGVTFPVLAKTEVIGKNAEPLFQYLTACLGFNRDSVVPDRMKRKYLEIDPRYMDTPDIKWNFTKFLVSRDGNPIKRFEPETTPPMLEVDIHSALTELADPSGLMRQRKPEKRKAQQNKRRMKQI